MIGRRIGELAAVTVLLCGLTAWITWPLASHLTSGVNDFGDPLLNSWILAWVAHTLPAHPAQLFSANIFFPETGTLAYSEPLIIPGLMVAPLLWLGADPILAHNLLLLAGYVLSGLAMYALVHSLVGERTGQPRVAVAAALIAAVIFALYPYRSEHVSKVQMELTWWMPLALLAVHRLGVSGKTGTGAWAGLFAALQTYSCIYYGIFLVAPLAVVSFGALVASPRGRRASVARGLLIGAIVWAGACAPLIAPYRAAARVVGERTPEEAQRWSARPSDYLSAHPESAMYGRPAKVGETERRLFPGFVTPALAIVAVVPPFSAAAVTYAAVAAVSADLSLGFNGAGYRTLYDWVPPFRAVRVPARFGMLVGLALAVLAGLGAVRLLAHRSLTAHVAIVLVVIAAVTIESKNRPLDLSELPDRAPAVYTWLAEQPPGVVCEYPVGNLEGRVGPQDSTYMYYSTQHWHPLVNGYSGFAPPSYGELLDRLRAFPDDGSIDYLRARRVTYLLVHSVFYLSDDFDRDVRALKARPDLTPLGRFSWKGGGYSEAFRIDF